MTDHPDLADEPFESHAYKSGGDDVSSADLTEMRAWLADNATFERTDPEPYLDPEVVADHEVLWQIERRYFGRRANGIAAFLDDGHPITQHHNDTGQDSATADADGDADEPGRYRQDDLLELLDDQEWSL